MGGWQVTVCGDLTVTDGVHVLLDPGLPGPQGRLVLAMLAVEHRRLVLRDEIADELWPTGRPEAWDVAVRAIVSKLRRSLDVAGLTGDAVTATRGGYRLAPLGPVLVDVASAASSIHRAEACARQGDLQGATGPALVASTVSARPFLTGFDGPWVTTRRAEKLRDTRIRALALLAESWIALDDPGQAVRDAEAALALDPYREGLYRVLMRAHSSHGDRAGAAKAYRRLRSGCSPTSWVSRRRPRPARLPTSSSATWRRATGRPP